MATPAAHWQREGHSTVCSWIVADGAQPVIDFMTEVLHAKTLVRMANDADNTVQHASLRIGDTVVMIHDSNKEAPAFPAWLHVYVEDVDETYAQARRKGLASVCAPKDEPYGDRMGAVRDSAGNTWWLATHKFTPAYSQTAGSEQREQHASTA